MELRVFIPDSPRRAWSAIKYYLGVRKSPVKVYGIEDMRRKHRDVLELAGDLRSEREKNAALRARLAEVSKELSRLKRGGE